MFHKVDGVSDDTTPRRKEIPWYQPWCLQGCQPSVAALLVCCCLYQTTMLSFISTTARARETKPFGWTGFRQYKWWVAYILIKGGLESQGIKHVPSSVHSLPQHSELTEHPLVSDMPPLCLLDDDVDGLWRISSMPGCFWKYLLIRNDADLLTKSPTIAEIGTSIHWWTSSTWALAVEKG